MNSEFDVHAIERKRAFRFNQSGFMQEPMRWDEEVALKVAHEDGLKLSGYHWAVIEAYRWSYYQTGEIPKQKLVCVINGLKGNGVRKLFKSKSKSKADKEVCRVAGVPDPYNH